MLADIQNFALRAHYVCTACMAFPPKNWNLTELEKGVNNCSVLSGENSAPCQRFLFQKAKKPLPCGQARPFLEGRTRGHERGACWVHRPWLPINQNGLHSRANSCTHLPAPLSSQLVLGINILDHKNGGPKTTATQGRRV